MDGPCLGSNTNCVCGSVVIPTSGTFCRYEPSSPAGFNPYSANCVARYSAAISPPRWPVPRPSSRSCERKRTCQRMCSGLIVSSALNAVPGSFTETASCAPAGDAGAGLAPPSAHTSRLSVAMATVSTLTTLWTLFCKIIRITMARIDRLSPPRSGTCLGKHGILEIMMKTDGIVTERRKFNDQGNRVITHTRVHALPRLGWSFINYRGHRGYRAKASVGEGAESSINRHPEVRAASGHGSWAPKSVLSAARARRDQFFDPQPA